MRVLRRSAVYHSIDGRVASHGRIAVQFDLVQAEAFWWNVQ